MFYTSQNFLSYTAADIVSYSGGCLSVIFGVHQPSMFSLHIFPHFLLCIITSIVLLHPFFRPSVAPRSDISIPSHPTYIVSSLFVHAIPMLLALCNSRSSFCSARFTRNEISMIAYIPLSSLQELALDASTDRMFVQSIIKYYCCAPTTIQFRAVSEQW
jgi:hypothetical protein